MVVNEPRKAGCLAYTAFLVAIVLVLGICFVCGGLAVDQWPA